MKKRQTQETFNRVRGQLMHLFGLVREPDSRRSIQRSLDELGEIEEAIGLNDANCYSPEDEEDDDE